MLHGSFRPDLFCPVGQGFSGDQCRGDFRKTFETVENPRSQFPVFQIAFLPPFQIWHPPVENPAGAPDDRHDEIRLIVVQGRCRRVLVINISEYMNHRKISHSELDDPCQIFAADINHQAICCFAKSILGFVIHVMKPGGVCLFHRLIIFPDQFEGSPSHAYLVGVI